MSQLFSKSAIRQAISSFQGHDLSREIAIVQELYEDFRKGNMKDETRYEQNFNELFFHQLLGYLPKTNMHPKASTPVGSKIADVGLGFFEDGLYSYEGVKVVVELKGCDTLLDKKQASYGGQSPVDQGFGYKTSFKNCPWLIVSNFASVRLYRDNKQDFEIWTIEDLANPDNEYYNLKTLLGLLKRNHLISQSGTSFSEKLLSEVRTKQEQITKDFYKQYKTLRFELINDIRHHNPEIHVETVVEKAQKIIDRIIFIHFCEDKGLLPEGKLKTNVIRAREADFSPWDVLKKYFKGVDSGSDKLEIPHGYNGGLFHTDPVLNDLEIGDAICHKFIDLGNYSFDDELSVNILGHIFEQSISDIEQLKGELLGEEITTDELVEKKESKRKKDGIFYTPEYIVDYIVQNSLMVYLEEKEQDCLDKIGKKGGYKTENEAYQAYQQILQNIKVLDPACGSGAFLVKVFDYLYAENKRVGQIVKSLFDDDEIYKSILRNNIYGVDLNPESVEITKLSLWLKSAQKGKKLNNLDDNIKCGNSLIDDPAVAGDRAFDRNKEFSDIMGAGGFDVIVGNPPYVRQELFKDIKKTLEKKFNCYNSIADLYTYFIELGILLINGKGRFSFILPNKFLKAQYGEKIRKFILENIKFEILFDFNDYQVFDDATTYPVIFVMTKDNRKKDFSYSTIDKNIIGDPITSLESKAISINHNQLSSEAWILESSNQNNIITKMNKNAIPLKDIVNDKIFRGVSTGKNEVFIISKQIAEKLINDKNRNHIRRIVTGKEVKRNSLVFEEKYLLFIPRDYDLDFDDSIKKYLLTNKELLSNRPEVKEGRFNWRCLSRYGSKNAEYLFQKKIIYPRINNQCNFYYDETGEYSLSDNNFFISTNEQYLVAILNSKLLFYFIKSYAAGLQGGYFDFRRPYIEGLPIKKISNENKKILEKLSIGIHHNNQELHDKTDSFLRYISSKFGLEKLSTKLSKFYDYDFATFLKEFKSVKLSMNEEAELMEFFETKKSEIVSLKNQIDATDREIDEMVFELYGLSEEEKAIIEGS